MPAKMNASLALKVLPELFSYAGAVGSMLPNCNTNTSETAKTTDRPEAPAALTGDIFFIFFVHREIPSAKRVPLINVFEAVVLVVGPFQLVSCLLRGLPP
jgi:hypothetical protein